MQNFVTVVGSSLDKNCRILRGKLRSDFGKKSSTRGIEVFAKLSVRKMQFW